MKWLPLLKRGMLKQNPNITSKEMEIGLAMMKNSESF
jgi:hypothetical protein